MKLTNGKDLIGLEQPCTNYPTYDSTIWEFPKTILLDELPDNKYVGKIFMIMRQNEAIALYIIDDGWAHFKASFHEMWLQDLKNLLAWEK